MFFSNSTSALLDILIITTINQTKAIYDDHKVPKLSEKYHYIYYKARKTLLFVTIAKCLPGWFFPHFLEFSALFLIKSEINSTRVIFDC